MKRIINIFIITLIFLSTPISQIKSTINLGQTAQIKKKLIESSKIKSFFSKVPFYTKQSGGYIFSKKGIKDIALAYCLGMGLTALHEFGHAITAKLLCGDPIDITLGASSGTTCRQNTYLQICGIKLGGFNPATGFSMIPWHPPLQEVTLLLMGPIFGALSSLAAYILLQKRKGFYITKAVSLFGLFNHTVGITGLGGIWLAPQSDVARVVSLLALPR